MSKTVATAAMSSLPSSLSSGGSTGVGNESSSASDSGEGTAAPAPVLARCHDYPSSSAAAYTDFSSVPEPCSLEEVLSVNAESTSPPQRRDMNASSIRRRGGVTENGENDGGGGKTGEGGGGRANSRRGPYSHATFPTKLHDILSRPDVADIVGWLPHGRSWRILDQTAFVNCVMPHFFTQSKFASFMRQVNGWGFVRVTSGNDANSYYSELFLRGKRSLVRFMERKPAIRNMLGPEPNFAEYKTLPPNPEVDLKALIPLPPLPLVPTMSMLQKKVGKRGRMRRSSAVSSLQTGKVDEVSDAIQCAALPGLLPPMAVSSTSNNDARREISTANQWGFEQAMIQQEQQRLFLGKQPGLQGQMAQQPLHQAPPFPAMQEAFLQVGTHMVMQPDVQGQMQMPSQGFQGVVQQQQQQKFSYHAGSTVAANMMSPSLELSQSAVPHSIGSANTTSASMQLQQLKQEDTFKLTPTTHEMGNLLQSGQLGGTQHEQSYSQDPRSPDHHLHKDQNQQQSLAYQLIDPTPLPEGRSFKVSAQPHQVHSSVTFQGSLTSKTAANSLFAESNPFAFKSEDKDGSADIDVVKDVDSTGLMPETLSMASSSASFEAETGSLGSESFMGGNLDDIW